MSNEIEVNEYVRTDKGEIAKVTSVAKETLGEIFGTNEIHIGFCNTEPYVYENIVKHNKQLIGVIECGDFVNGMEILHIEDNKLYVEWNNEFEEFTGFLENKDIKTIPTKEQFVANCYKVGGEDEC